MRPSVILTPSPTPHTPPVTILSTLTFFTFITVASSTGCSYNLTGSYGVVVSPGYPQAYPVNVDCTWYIAPNTTGPDGAAAGMTLYVRRFVTQEGTGGGDDDLETLLVYTSDPSNGTATPVQRYRGKVSPGLRLSLASSRAWLRFQSSSQQTPTAGSDTLGFRLVYLYNGVGVVTCDAQPLQHGRIKNSNGTFALDSVAEFECDTGYRLAGSVRATCILDGDGTGNVAPRWSALPKCVSTCVAPMPQANQTYVQSDASFHVNSTVTFSCHAPYRLRGATVLTCVLGQRGVPQWDNEAPTCTIPDCSSAITFTDPSGALVNPSYPRRFVAGGRNCDWNIHVEQGKAVGFTFQYVDLPAGGQLTIRDGISKRLLLHISPDEGSVPESFNSSGASVEVVYNGPQGSSSAHQGFFIKYKTVEQVSVAPPPRIISTTSTVSRSTPTPQVVASTTTEQPHRSTESADDGGGTPAGTIAAGVTVPLILITIIALVGYRCYRKKFPVRMIMGRDFGKFSNPEYRNPSKLHTLVREDADEFFQETQPSSPVSLIMEGGDSEPKVSFVNEGFQYDSQDADEEEVERRFRERKAYLFKKQEDEGEDEADGGDGGPSRKQPRSKGAGRDQGHDNAAYSDDSDTDVKQKKRAGSEEEPKDKDRSGSDSKEVSVSSPSDGKDKPETPQESESPGKKDGGDAPADSSPVTGTERRDSGREFQPGMTVRDFLRWNKERRANSDVARARADSLTVYDRKKSSRRRAQSAEDIWARASQQSEETTKEQLARGESDMTSSAAAGRHPQNAYENVHITHENLAELTAERSTDEHALDKSDVVSSAAPSMNSQPAYENVHLAHENFPALSTSDGPSESVHKVQLDDDQPQKTGAEALSRDQKVEVNRSTEEDRNSEISRSDSMSSLGSYVSVHDIPPASRGELAGNDVSDKGSRRSVESQSTDSSDSSLDQEPVAGTGTPDKASLSDSNDYVNVTASMVQSLDSPEPQTLARDADNPKRDDASASEGEADDSADLTSRDMTVETEKTASLDKAASSIEDVSLSEVDGLETGLASAGADGDIHVYANTQLSEHLTDDSGDGPWQDFSSVKRSVGSDSPPSSLEVHHPDDIMDVTAHDKDSDSSSTKSLSPPAGDSASSETDSDDASYEFVESGSKELQEEEGSHLNTSDDEPSEGPKKPVSVRILKQMTHSDASSETSSSDDGSDQDDPTETKTAPETNPLKFGLTSPLRFGGTASGGETRHPTQLSRDPGEAQGEGQAHSQLMSSSDSELPPALPSSSPPQPPRLRGLAALRTHRSVTTKPSESDSDDDEFTEEDIDKALAESSDGSSDEGFTPQAPQPLQIGVAAPRKIQPMGAFVFTDEDNEDFDV